MEKRREFERFISENIDAVYRFAFVFTKNKEDAEDVVNESVIRALRGIKNLRDSRYMKTWFYRIVINTSYSYMKKRSNTISFEDEYYLSEGEYDDYSALTVESLIHMLDEKYRSIIVLRFCEDMQIKDIAHILDENENTVKTRLYKALKMLKKEAENL